MTLRTPDESVMGDLHTKVENLIQTVTGLEASLKNSLDNLVNRLYHSVPATSVVGATGASAVLLPSTGATAGSIERDLLQTATTVGETVAVDTIEHEEGV